jgi:transposase-like protein DUF772
MEHPDDRLLLRWCTGLNMEDAVWDATVFSKNRERWLKGRWHRCSATRYGHGLPSWGEVAGGGRGGPISPLSSTSQQGGLRYELT